jgi:hypothetical protein
MRSTWSIALLSVTISASGCHPVVPIVKRHWWSLKIIFDSLWGVGPLLNKSQSRQSSSREEFLNVSATSWKSDVYRLMPQGIAVHSH